MKRIRVFLSILLAMVLLLIPSAVLADDPPDVEVDIGIISGGDVDVDLGIDAGGDVSIGVGTNSDVNVNGDGLATKDDLVSATGSSGVHAYEAFVCGGSRTAIKDIYRLLEELFGRQYLIADGLAKDIVLTQETEQWLSRLTVYTYSQDIALENQKDAIVYVNTKMDDLIDVANHQVTELNQRVALQEQAQLEMRSDYNFKLLAVSLSALIVIIVLGIIATRARRRA